MNYIHFLNNVKIDLSPFFTHFGTSVSTNLRQVTLKSKEQFQTGPPQDFISKKGPLK